MLAINMLPLQGGMGGAPSGPLQAGAPLYTKQEVIANFEGLLPALSLHEEIDTLGCGLNSFFNKSRSLAEFTAMCTALWKLALDRSFPNESGEFFEDFLANSPVLGTGKKHDKMVSRIRIYCDLFAPKKIDDFTPVSQYMAETLCKDTQNRKALHLKLSLTIRKIYQVIFEHLI